MTDFKTHSSNNMHHLSLFFLIPFSLSNKNNSTSDKTHFWLNYFLFFLLLLGLLFGCILFSVSLVAINKRLLLKGEDWPCFINFLLMFATTEMELSLHLSSSVQSVPLKSAEANKSQYSHAHKISLNNQYFFDQTKIKICLYCENTMQQRMGCMVN